MNLESELKTALQRVDPPEGFAGKVMARVEDRRSRLSGQARLPVLHKALAAAALIAALLGGWGVHETLRARSQLLTAMRVASHEVAHVQQEIRK